MEDEYGARRTTDAEIAKRTQNLLNLEYEQDTDYDEDHLKAL